MDRLPLTSVHAEITGTSCIADDEKQPWKQWPFRHNLTPQITRYHNQVCDMVYTHSGFVLQMHIDPNNDRSVRDYIAALILSRARPLSPVIDPSLQPSSMDHPVDDVTRLFEMRLMFDAHGMEFWHKSGRKLFQDKAMYWISHRRPIEFALPAFPCKTTNPEKAASRMPDSAEYEALDNLQCFCCEMFKLYPPGCRVNIVSDGHVFSDCQGTDDDVVTEYNTQLKAMLKTIEKHHPVDKGGILFHSLRGLLVPDMGVSSHHKDRSQPPTARSHAHSLNFSPVSGSDILRLLPSRDKLPTVNHPVRTQIAESDDFARALMIQAFATPPEYFQDLIKTVPDHPTTALFRGFSRFMFDDLAYHPDYKDASGKQRKKKAEEVALEMVQRNNTYSRVVEHLLPNHIRLSIHAHNNSGPKFAVQLVPHDTFMDWKGIGQQARSALQVPTPWHNTIVDFVTNTAVVTKLGKARFAQEAVESGMHTGRYVEDHPRGGRFVLS